ncbi:MAG: hypothetical protein JO354_00455 [Verrucomicrobia bacterium]|nr:hypothetical protein [Verrucomicrobiota bacterium]
MRFACVLGLCLFALQAHAQDQDRKLVERLLEPDMKMQNSAQNKRFTAISNVSASSASTHQFYVPEKKLTRNFLGTRQFATSQFSSRPFQTKAAYMRPGHETRTYPTRAARDVSTAREFPAKYSTRDFAGTRPFLGRGKSQQALHAQDHPLSIDDIRELLNKNK